MGARRPTQSLDDAVVVVVGASSGLGRAAALAFGRHRARVVLAARSDEALAVAEAACLAGGARATLRVVIDVARPADVERLVEETLRRFGTLDVWVQAAASVLAGRLQDSSVEEIEHVVRTDVVGTAVADRAALRTFEAQGHGTLINVASLLGLLPNPAVPTYVLSKFAIRGLTLSLQAATASSPSIHVCLVAPGPIDTPLFQRTANRTGRQLRAIPPALSVERVAAAVVACARRPRPEVSPGVLPTAARWAHRLAPRSVESLAARYGARTITTSAPARDSAGALLDPQAGPGATGGGWRRGRLRRAAGDRFGRWQADRGRSAFGAERAG